MFAFEKVYLSHIVNNVTSSFIITSFTFVISQAYQASLNQKLTCPPQAWIKALHLWDIESTSLQHFFLSNTPPHPEENIL